MVTSPPHMSTHALVSGEHGQAKFKAFKFIQAPGVEAEKPGHCIRIALEEGLCILSRVLRGGGGQGGDVLW